MHTWFGKCERKAAADYIIGSVVRAELSNLTFHGLLVTITSTKLPHILSIVSHTCKLSQW